MEHVHGDGASTRNRTAPVVTAVRAKGARTVAVELDGTAWRVLPLDAVATAGVTTGVTLDRWRARELNRALRASRALEVAERALRYADHTRATLDQRLRARGVAAPERAEALGVVERAGIVDDRRFAEQRAAALAARGYGNAAIADDLGRRGVEDDLVRSALAALEPEETRARRLVARRGGGVRGARYLGGKGFDPDTIEAVVAVEDLDGIG